MVNVMSKLNKGLMVLVAVMALISVGWQIKLTYTIIDLNQHIIDQHYKIANKDLQLSILWQEIDSLQKINMEMNNKNSELRGYTNFLESQNAMLMDKNEVEK